MKVVHVSYSKSKQSASLYDLYIETVSEKVSMIS